MVLQQTTIIAAPMPRIFDLARSIDVEKKLIRKYGGRVIGGRKTGLIEYDETVTWGVRQFGLRVRHTSRITGFEPPSHFADCYFQDAMEEGVFKHFWHDHYFTAEGETTRMRDVISFRMPVSLLGSIADRGWVRTRLETLLAERNSALKKIAESEEWRKYL